MSTPNDLLEQGCPHCGGPAGWWGTDQYYEDIARFEADSPFPPNRPVQGVTKVWIKCNCKERDPDADREADIALDHLLGDLNACYHSLWVQYEALPWGYDFQI